MCRGRRAAIPQWKSGTPATRAGSWRILINGNGPVPGITPFATRAPYPEWQAIQFIVGDGIGNYNAFSAKLSQRFASGFTTLFSYTWSKAMDENSAIRGTGDDFTPQDPHCRACEKGPAGFNIPHRFVTSILYTLPLGKGQKFLNYGGIVNQWWVAGNSAPLRRCNPAPRLQPDRGMPRGRRLSRMGTGSIASPGHHRLRPIRIRISTSIRRRSPMRGGQVRNVRAQ